MPRREATSAVNAPFIFTHVKQTNEPVGVVLKGVALSAEIRGSIPGPLKSDTLSPTVRHRCDVSSELCFPSAKPLRWAQPLVYKLRHNTASLIKI